MQPLSSHPSLSALSDEESWLKGSRICRQDAFLPADEQPIERLQDLPGAVGFDVEKAASQLESSQAPLEPDGVCQVLAELVTEAVFTLDEEGTICSANRVAEKLFGYSVQLLLGEPVNRLFAERVRQDYQAAFDQFRTVQIEPILWKAVPWIARHQNGREFSVQVSLGQYAEGDRRVFVQTVRNLNEGPTPREQLHWLEERRNHDRRLLDVTELCLFLKDREGRYLAVNRAFCRTLGLAEAEILGKTDHDLYPAEWAERASKEEEQVVASSTRQETELESRQQGNASQIKLVRSPVMDASGRVEGIAGAFWDVTQSRALECRLQQVHKLEALGELAGGMAHSFNNLFTVILSNVSLVLAEQMPLANARDLLKAVEQAALRAAELTNQLRGLSKQGPLRRQPAHLRYALSDTLTVLRRILDSRIILECHCEETLWPVRIDVASLNQVLMNLALNARDAMPEGGRLTVEFLNRQLTLSDSAAQPQARPGAFVCIRVEDTGHGIPEELLPRIYEPFFTTKPKGTASGLGLSLVFGMVRQHDGWIECSSQVHKGTRFDILLPRWHEPVAIAPTPAPPVVTEAIPAEQSPPSPPSSLEGATLLLVDDDPMIRLIGERILGKQGFRILLADDGLDAVDIYQRELGNIQLVILDMSMPRLSGRETLSRLLELDPTVQVLFSSGHSNESFGELCDQEHIGFIQKPYRADDLARAVRKMLMQRPAP